MIRNEGGRKAGRKERKRERRKEAKKKRMEEIKGERGSMKIIRGRKRHQGKTRKGGKK